ncbi:MAG: LamB/YcsF family protein [Planctomycetota bacterium]
MSSPRTIHLTCDTGEAPAGPARDREHQLLVHVSLACIACGGHAGDEASMIEAVVAAKAANVRVAAHPSYPDRINFGRKSMSLGEHELAKVLGSEIETFRMICEGLGVPVFAVKPHGALYHAAATTSHIAHTLAQVTIDIAPKARIIAPAGSATLSTYTSLGLGVLAEAFADRRYEADGSLRSRSYANATITDPYQAAEQARSIAVNDSVTAVDGSRVPLHTDAVCIHSDTPNAVEIASAVGTTLKDAGVAIGP